MNFILSSETIDDIIFAMENQNGIFSFDALEGICVDEDAVDDEYETVTGDERYYDIPEWSSAQGFRVMEQFTAQVHNPLLREALLEALRQRKGVFRRYKEVLKTAPTIEREWYRFKERQMRAAVYEWYNELRIIWGLEKIGFEEETEPQLLQQDFSFQVRRAADCNAGFLQHFIRTPAFFSANNEELSIAAAAAIEVIGLLAQAALPSGKTLDDAVVITADTGDEPCALCLLTEFSQEQCLCIPFLRVLPEYRGLGLGKELLQRAASHAEQTGARALVFADPCVSSYFIAALERNGFRQTGLLYVKEIEEDE